MSIWSGRVGRRIGEPVDRQRDRDPDQRGADPERDHPRDRVLLARDPRILLGRACRRAGRWVPLAHRRASVLVRGGRARSQAASAESARPAARRRGRAHGGRRVAVVAAERLGELGRLAVADGPRDSWRPAASPSRSSSAARAMRTRWSSWRKLVPCLGEHALELAPGRGDRVRDRAQRELLVRVVARRSRISASSKRARRLLLGRRAAPYRVYVANARNWMLELCCRRLA